MAFIRCCVRGGVKSAQLSPPQFQQLRDESDQAQYKETNPLCTQELLFEAAENGDREVVRRHIDSGFDVNVVDPEDGYTALLLASECGQLGVVEELSTAGVRLDEKDSFGRTAIYAAAVAGHAEVVAALVQAGADATIADDDGRTVFWAALALRHLEIAELLLEMARVDVDACDNSGTSPLMYAIEAGHADCIRFLRDHGAAYSGGRLAV